MKTTIENLNVTPQLVETLKSWKSNELPIYYGSQLEKLRNKFSRQLDEVIDEPEKLRELAQTIVMLTTAIEDINALGEALTAEEYEAN